MAPVIIGIAAVFIVPIVALVFWSLGKSGKLKQRQIDHWQPLADELGGALEQHEGRWNHHVLRATVHGAPVHATISHKVAVDANIAGAMRTNNEFRTQIHAATAEAGPGFIVTGTRPGKGKLTFGFDDFRSHFRVDRDSGFESVASEEVQTLMLDLYPHFQRGAQLVNGGNVVSLVFASNTTDPEAVGKGVRLVGALAAPRT